MMKALLLRLTHHGAPRIGALAAVMLLMAAATMAQSRTETATPVKTETEQPVLDQDGAGVPTLSREVKQELSKAASSPEAPARKEEPTGNTGPVPAQVFIESEPQAEPTPEQPR
jgi:hypothetical protein